jgi:3-deoxy-D-manno-octulosonic-acid transferase
VRSGVPTLAGPGFANFEDLVPPLRAAGLLQVVAAEDLARALAGALAAAPRRAAGAAALPEALRGTLGRTLALVSPHLPPPVSIPKATL